MITEKDQSILNFIEDFHIVTSGQLQRLFYPHSYRYCMTRLAKLVRDGLIKKTVSTINNCHAYYIGKKPVQIHHDLIRTEIYTHLSAKFDVLEWHNEYTFEHIRPDALCYIRDHEIVFPVIVEIHLNNKFDFDKYTMDFIPIFGCKPRVLIITDREVTIPHTGLVFKVIGLDMKGIENILK